MTTISATEMCKRAGVTGRQLDYWVRCGVVTPVEFPRGNGRPRRYAERQVPVVRLVAALSSLGATSTTTTPAAAQAELIPADSWFGHVYIDDEGHLHLSAPAGSCYAVDLGECADLEPVPRQLVLA